MKETLEEAAERLFPFTKDDSENRIITIKRLSWIEGAQWQAERMYSEEDMIKFAEFVTTYPDKNKNVNGEILHAKSKYDGAERTIDLLQIWFKQFKKK